MTRSASGRPLRFFAIILAAWVCIRVFGPDLTTSLPLPVYHTAPTSLALVPLALLDSSALPAIQPFAPILPPPQRDGALQPPSHDHPGRRSSRSPKPTEDSPLDLMGFIGSMSDYADPHNGGVPANIGGLHPPSASPPPLLKTQPLPDRWRAGAWLFWRQGSFAPNQTVPTGQLGGSQAGLRVDYDIAPHAATRMASYGRLTSALQRPTAPEAALGLSVQPVRTIPITLAAERRIALGHGGRNANAVMAVGGFGPTALAPSILGEAYVQTGIVGFRRQDAFIDGKFSLTTPLARTPVRLGVAISGGAQPGASRLDIGPELQVRLPLQRSNARLSVEWRERIAGNARPGSGLSITLAADF